MIEPPSDPPQWRLLVDRIEQVANIASQLKVLATSIFGLGVWVAYQTFSIQAMEVRLHQIEQDRALQTAEWRTWREKVDERISGMQADVSWIRATLSRTRN
jgi:hypothetical protein